MLVADGVNGRPLVELAKQLAADGAVPRFIGSQLGRVKPESGDPIEIDVPVDGAPAVVFDAVVLPDGVKAVRALTADGRMVEFLKDQYRHCKPILVLGAGTGLIEKAGIPLTVPAGEADPGIVVSADGRKAFEAFKSAIAAHRHYARETNPPRV
jgi:catalase